MKKRAGVITYRAGVITYTEPMRKWVVLASAALGLAGLAALLAWRGLRLPPGHTQILPLRIGDAARAVAASERALHYGVFAQAIRPPTVPDGTSRLRLTVMASHTKSELREAAKAVAASVPVGDRGPSEQPTEEIPALGSGRIFDRLADAA